MTCPRHLFLVAFSVVVCSTGVLRAASTVQMPDVDVRAESRARELLDQPRRIQPSLEISQATIDQPQLQRQGARVLTDGVQYLPGTWTETRGRKVKQFVSYRGQMYPYPDFAWNGVWLPEFHEMPYLVPASSVERIEMTRSASGLFLGMSGDSGVIDLIPRAPEGPRHLMLRGARFGTTEMSVFAPLTPEPGGLALSSGYYRSDGPSGRHAAEDRFHGMLVGEWRLGPQAMLSMQVLGLRANRELTNARPPAGLRLQNTRERYEPFQALLAGFRLDVEHAGAATTSLGFAGAYRDNDFVNDGAGGHVTMREEDYSLTLDVTHVRPLTEANRLRLGAVYNHFAAPDGKRFIEGRRVDYDTLALIVADEQQIGAVLIDGGVRVSRRYFRNYAGFSVDGSSRGLENTEAIQGEWDKPRVRLTAGVRWFAAPDLEGFANLAHDRIDPRSGTLDENLAEPETETRINSEIGVRNTRSNGTVWEVAGFSVYRRDGLLLTGQTAVTPVGNEFELYRNQDLRQYGVEAGFRQLPVVPGVTAFANLTYLQSDAKNAIGDYERFVEIPEWIGAAGMDAIRGPWGFGMYLKTVSEYESNRFAADGGFKPLGDFKDLQMRLKRRLTSYAALTLSVENLLDEEYSTVVGYPDFGRRFGAQLDMIW